MKKLLVILSVLCLLFSVAALAETTAFTFRNNVTFGMSENDVIAAENNNRYELDREHTHGPVDFNELEYEHVTENGVRTDITYLFANGKLAAIRLDYDTRDISYNTLKDFYAKTYGAAAPIDTALLGNGIYAVDDDGRPHRGAEFFTDGKVMVVLELDDDDIDVTIVDLTAAYIK